MGPPTLLRLAPELQDNIVACFNKYRDLKALCLTCKQLNDVTTPRLYRRVEITVPSATRNAILTKRHSGHAHVKDFILHCVGYPEDSNAIGNAILRVLLLLLPRNSLRRIEGVGAFRIEPETLMSILTQQSMLQSLSFDSVCSSAESPPVCQYASTLKNLRMLSIGDMWDTSAIDLFKILLRENRATLEILQMCTGAYDSEVTSLAHERSIELFEELFGTDLQNAPRLVALQGLMARFMDFTYNSYAWAQLIPFETLRFLALVNCDGLLPFLLALTTCFQASGAKLVGLVCRRDVGYVPTMELEGLLRSFSGLRHCELEDYDPEVPFDSTSLSNHYSTLQSLKLCKGGEFGSYMQTVPMDELLVMAEACINLSQLSIAFPAFSTSDSKGDNWADFGETLALVSRLAKLSVLHVHTWPIASSRGGRNRKLPTLVEYEEDLKHLACRVLSRFETARSNQSPKLRLLAFGDARVENDAATEKTRTIRMDDRRFYVRKEQVSDSGSSAPTMMSVQPKEIERHLPGFDMICQVSGDDLGMHNDVFRFDLD